MRHRVERDIADLDAFAGQRGANTPHDRGHAGEQFSRGKRLGEVIVGARIEPAHAVVLGLACGEHDDRDMRGLFVAPQPAANLDPAGAFDHPVEDDEVGHILGRQQQCLVAVWGRANLVAFVGEAVFEQLRKSRVVFHQ